MNLQVIPAVDLRAGRVVRLLQGDYDRCTTYAVDPMELAARYARAGAQWLHVVDLDGARNGGLENLRCIEAIAREGIEVQAGGGVRNADDARQLFGAGAARVVIGSVAVREPERAAEWLEEFGAERLVIALDTRHANGNWTLPVAGWCESSLRTLEELTLWYAAHGLRHLLCTDIARDGMLAGCNVDLYRYLAQIAPTLAIQASGGVRSIDELRALRMVGASAVILGRVLLEGGLALEDALNAVSAVTC